MKIIFFPLFILLVISCTRSDVVVSFHGSTMGTTYNIKFVGSSGMKNDLKVAVDELLEKVNDSMSTYRKESELSVINNSNSSDWFTISSGLNKVMKTAMMLSRQSDGAYDVTLGPLVNLWGFGPDGARRVPSPKEIEIAKGRSGYKKIVLEQGKLKKNSPNVYIDLSSIAKGYGVDVISEYFELKQIKNYLIEVGGELRASGQKPDAPWKIAIQTPGQDTSSIHQVLVLKNYAVATSGDYRNYFDEQNKRYSHTIDARTGVPVENTLASVTVVSESSCMLADGQTTMLLAMGKNKAIRFVEDGRIAAYLIWRKGGQFRVYKSTRFLELFK